MWVQILCDVATIANPMEDPENLQIGRETNAVNFSAGFNFAVFDGPSVRSVKQKEKPKQLAKI